MNLHEQPFDPAVADAVLHEPGEAASRHRRQRGAAHRLHVEGQGAAPGDGQGPGLRGPTWPRSGVVREGLLQGPRRSRRRRAQGHHQGLPQAGARQPSRHASRRRRRRGAVQGGQRGVRRARRRGQAQGVRRGPRARPDGGGFQPGGGPGGFGGRTFNFNVGSRRPRRHARADVRPRSPRRRRRRRRPVRSAAPTSRPTLTLDFADAGARPHHHAVPHQRRAVQHLPRQRRQAGHAAEGLLAVRRAWRDRRQPGLLLVLLAVPRVPRRAAWSSRSRARRAAAPASSAGRARCRCASPPASPTARRIRLKGRGAPGRNGGPAGDLIVECHVTAAPRLRARRQQPHRARADHVRRGRARRRRRGADARRRPGQAAAQGPARRRARATASRARASRPSGRTAT